MVEGAGRIVKLNQEIRQRLLVVQGQVDGELQAGRIVKAPERWKTETAAGEMAGRRIVAAPAPSPRR